MNTHGKPIFIAVTDYPNGYGYSYVSLAIDGASVLTNMGIGDMKNTSNQASATMLIPDGSAYSVSFRNGVYGFWEFW